MNFLKKHRTKHIYCSLKRLRSDIKNTNNKLIKKIRHAWHNSKVNPNLLRRISVGEVNLREIPPILLRKLRGDADNIIMDLIMFLGSWASLLIPGLQAILTRPPGLRNYSLAPGTGS